MGGPGRLPFRQQLLGVLLELAGIFVAQDQLVGQGFHAERGTRRLVAWRGSWKWIFGEERCRLVGGDAVRRGQIRGHLWPVHVRRLGLGGS